MLQSNNSNYIYLLNDTGFYAQVASEQQLYINYIISIFIYHVYLTFILFTFNAQRAEDNYLMFYWTINSYRIIFICTSCFRMLY